MKFRPSRKFGKIRATLGKSFQRPCSNHFIFSITPVSHLISAVWKQQNEENLLWIPLRLQGISCKISPSHAFPSKRIEISAFQGPSQSISSPHLRASRHTLKIPTDPQRQLHVLDFWGAAAYLHAYLSRLKLQFWRSCLMKPQWLYPWRHRLCNTINKKFSACHLTVMPDKR